MSRGRSLGEYAQSGPRSRDLDHPPRSSISLPVPGDGGQSAYPIGRASRGSLRLRARRVSNLRKGEVRVLGLELDVHLPPLRIFLAGSVPSLLTNQAKRIHPERHLCRSYARNAAANLTNQTDHDREGEEEEEEERDPGSTTVRDRSLASNATTDPVAATRDRVRSRLHVHDTRRGAQPLEGRRAAVRGFEPGEGDALLGNLASRRGCDLSSFGYSGPRGNGRNEAFRGVQGPNVLERF